MSEMFSASFAYKLRSLKKKGLIKKPIPRDLIPKPWVVYAKQAFGSPESVVEYLGRYTHRVAISNARIIKVTDTHVTFRWCNRKDNYKTETETITGVEFLKRFLQHIVPAYYRRIRHLGFLSTRTKSASITSIRESLKSPMVVAKKLSRAEILCLRFGERSVLTCVCGGELHLYESYARSRDPPVKAGLMTA
jgi:hypothetical protein